MVMNIQRLEDYYYYRDWKAWQSTRVISEAIYKITIHKNQRSLLKPRNEPRTFSSSIPIYINLASSSTKSNYDEHDLKGKKDCCNHHFNGEDLPDFFEN